jgi:hypothetical protein
MALNKIHPWLINRDALIVLSSFSTIAIGSFFYSFLEPTLSTYWKRQRAIRKTPITKQKLLTYLSSVSTSLSSTVTDALIKAVAEHEKHRAIRSRLGESINPLPLVKLHDLMISTLKIALNKIDSSPTETEAEQAIEHFIESKNDKEVSLAIKKVKESHPLFLSPSILLKITEEKLEAEYKVYVSAKDDAEKQGIDFKSLEFADLLRKKMINAGGSVLLTLAGVEDDGKVLPCMTVATLTKYGIGNKALLWTSILAYAHDEERIVLGAGKKGIIAIGIEKLFTKQRDNLSKLGMLSVSS